MMSKYAVTRARAGGSMVNNNCFGNRSIDGLIPFMPKYDLFVKNNKRYYKFDMTTELPSLENTIPYCFKYGNIEVYDSSWNRITVKIAEELDKLNHKEESFLLSLKYGWSKAEVFSTSPRINFLPFKSIYLNTNHTSTHAMMNIQLLLKAYDVNASECIFIIRRHPVAEPKEVRDHFKSVNIAGFRRCLAFRGFKQESIDTTVNNFNFINKLLCLVSPGYDDFFLFDDYTYFCVYKAKVIEKAKIQFVYKEKTLKAIITTLNRLDDYYKNERFYDYSRFVGNCK